MARAKKKARKRVRKTFGLILAAAAVYLAIHMLRAASNTFETQRAQDYTARETISAPAYVLRNESVLKSSANGVLRYLASDGARVSKNGAVAEIYASADQVRTIEQIDLLRAQVGELRQAQIRQEGVAVDITAIEKQIRSGYYSALRAFSRGDPVASTDLGNVLRLLNRKQILAGEVTDFNAHILDLESQIKTLEASSQRSMGSITADAAGYFVRQTGGRDSSADFAKATQLTVSGLKELKESADTVSGGVVGRIIRDYEWYIAVEMSMPDSMLIGDINKTDLSFPVSEVSEIPVKVAAINRDTASSKAVVVFSCTYMNEETAKIGNQPVDILLNNYSGLRIPRAAVRTIKGQRGVYVLKGNIARFEKITIIYMASDYFVIKAGQEVKQLDEVIVKGKGLYDGKVVG